MVHPSVQKLRDGRGASGCAGIDSLGTGTSTNSGYRGGLLPVLGVWGAGFAAVGTLTTQQGNLSTETSRNYYHEAVSGVLIGAWWTGVKAKLRAATVNPDILIMACGPNNDVGTLSASAMGDMVKTISKELKEIKPATALLWTGLQVRNSSGVPAMDSNLEAINKGIRDAAGLYDNCIYFDMHSALATSGWNAIWHLDSTHYGPIGYARAGLRLAQFLMGPATPPPCYMPSGIDTRTSISADVDFPWGGNISASGGTIKVTTWLGQDVTLVFGGSAGTAGALPANSTFDVPIVRIWNTGTTLGSNTINTFTYKPGDLR